MTRHLEIYYSRWLRSLETPQGLARLLGLSVSQLKDIIARPEYRAFSIPKSSGGRREILAPNRQLKELQQRLNVFLQCVYLNHCPNSVHGFTTRSSQGGSPRGIVSNAEMHIGKNYLLNLDLADFFHSISSCRVRNLFKSPPFSFEEELATCLTLLCCYEKKLPMGCPTSPVISNMICYPLDGALTDHCNANECVYTRYADDISISSNNPFTNGFIGDMKQLISEQGFALNEKKFRIQSRFTRQIVTGLKVNEKVNVDRKYIRNIRAILYHWKKEGLKVAAEVYFKRKGIPSDNNSLQGFVKSITGKVAFVGAVKGRKNPVFEKLQFNLEQLAKTQ